MPGAANPRALAAMIDLVADPETHAERAAELEAKRVEAHDFGVLAKSRLDRAGEMEAALDKRKAKIDATEASVAEREAEVERRQGEIKTREDAVVARELAVTQRAEVVERRIFDAFAGYAAIKRLIRTAFEDLQFEKL